MYVTVKVWNQLFRAWNHWNFQSFHVLTISLWDFVKSPNFLGISRNNWKCRAHFSQSTVSCVSKTVRQIKENLLLTSVDMVSCSCRCRNQSLNLSNISWLYSDSYHLLSHALASNHSTWQHTIMTCIGPTHRRTRRPINAYTHIALRTSSHRHKRLSYRRSWLMVDKSFQIWLIVISESSPFWRPRSLQRVRADLIEVHKISNRLFAVWFLFWAGHQY